MDDIRINKPSDIERESMSIIEAELKQRGIDIPAEHSFVIKRVIHTTADFEFARTLTFINEPVKGGLQTLQNNGVIVTDTTMALSGMAKVALNKLGAKAYCYVNEDEVTSQAKELQTTKAYASMRYALDKHPDAIFAVGNGPTALYSLAEQIAEGARPSLIIAVPVGFVNVVEAKEKIKEVCEEYDIPLIAAMGRKGGSTVATAIVNALLYEASGMIDPAARGWV